MCDDPRIDKCQGLFKIIAVINFVCSLDASVRSKEPLLSCGMFWGVVPSRVSAMESYAFNGYAALDRAVRAEIETRLKDVFS